MNAYNTFDLSHDIHAPLGSPSEPPLRYRGVAYLRAAATVTPATRHALIYRGIAHDGARPARPARMPGMARYRGVAY